MTFCTFRTAVGRGPVVLVARRSGSAVQFSLVLELQAHKDSFHLRPELWEALGAFQERHVHRVLFGFAGMLSGLQSMLYQT
ncbi:hypothetical protein FQA47_022200 [Oryzias melastigma]|uniref:Uncharacterized protein n=1 Tax=Oryzias melastigma TaxID=30732 RepID=A0A834FMT5_ORYME|nr:hypothetical protein FQA47_022200 [Oryzias melastigma]